MQGCKAEWVRFKLMSEHGLYIPHGPSLAPEGMRIYTSLHNGSLAPFLRGEGCGEGSVRVDAPPLTLTLSPHAGRGDCLLEMCRYVCPEGESIFDPYELPFLDISLNHTQAEYSALPVALIW